MARMNLIQKQVICLQHLWRLNDMMKWYLKDSFTITVFNNLKYVSRVGNGNPLQYSCLENPMDRVHRVTKESDMIEVT